MAVPDTQKAPEIAVLGKDANIVAALRKSAHSRFRLLGYAQKLLSNANVRNTKDGMHRTRLCHAARAFQAENITIKLSHDEENSIATLAGVQTCASVWSCPVCSARIAVQRGKEIAHALKWAEENGLAPIMITLTARHDKNMPLVEFKDKFKTAWRKMTQSRRYRAIKNRFQIEASIKAVEVSHGNKGWHYHSHGLLFVRREVLANLTADQEYDWTLDLRLLWLECLNASGLTGIGEFACNVAYHGDIPEKYLAKLGLDVGDQTDARHELSGGANKSGRGASIWTILRRARDGNSAAAKLYVEFAEAMQGDNWITWSHGLKDVVGLDEIDDADVANQDETPVETSDWLVITDDTYGAVRYFRVYAELLEIAASTRSRLEVVEYLQSLHVRRRNLEKKSIEDTRQQYSRVHEEFFALRLQQNKKWSDGRTAELTELHRIGMLLKQRLENIGEIVDW